MRFGGGNLPAGLEDGLVEGQPVWPFIYYCIRCGDLNAALTVAASASSTLGDFVLSMKEFAAAASPDSLAALSPSTASKLMLTYRRYASCLLSIPIPTAQTIFLPGTYHSGRDEKMKGCLFSSYHCRFFSLLTSDPCEAATIHSSVSFIASSAVATLSIIIPR